MSTTLKMMLSFAYFILFLTGPCSRVCLILRLESLVDVVVVMEYCELVGSGGDGVLINGIDGLVINERRVLAVRSGESFRMEV